MRIHVLDTTLSEIALSFNTRIAPGDRLRLLKKLEELAPDYIETDPETYLALGDYEPRESKVSVFVRRIEDLPAHAGVVSFGADFSPVHKEPALDQVRRMAAEGRTVLLIAENFFDAFNSNPHQAIDGLIAMREAGAMALILDDSRGGLLPSRLGAICRTVKERVDAPLGIRARNDGGVAVANTLAAVEHAFTWVAGAVNGYGERCGAANLCTVLADIELKLGHESIGHENLKHLSAVARFVGEAVNQPLPENAPFTGEFAFGPPLPSSAAAVLDSMGSVPHIDPESVGHAPAVAPEENTEGAAASWLHGEGYEMELADGTLELLRRQAQQPGFRGFEVLSWEITTRQAAAGPSVSTATVMVKVRNDVYHGTASGEGPVHAMLRAACDF